MLLTQLVHFMLRLQINRPLQLKGCNSTRLSRLRCTWSSFHLYLIQLIFAISHPVLFFIETFNCCWDLTECRLSLELAYHISPCLLKLFRTYSQHVSISIYVQTPLWSVCYISIRSGPVDWTPGIPENIDISKNMNTRKGLSAQLWDTETSLGGDVSKENLPFL